MVSSKKQVEGSNVDGTQRDRPYSATAGVTAHVEHLIFDGSLQPGDPLPSEAELAESLGVSRLTVREGIRTAQARGLLEVNHGRRAMVAHPNADPLRDFFSASVRRDARGLLDLLEVRLAVEVHVAALAAAHATRADLAALDMALTFMKGSVDDQAEFNKADVRFHAALASASGNRMLCFLVEGMEEPLHDGRVASIRGYRHTHPDLEGLIVQHTDIYERVVARDGRGAASAMRRHLLQTRKDLKHAFHAPTETGTEQKASVRQGNEPSSGQ